MKCDKCGKEAHVKVKAIMGEKSVDFNLCDECFEKYMKDQNFLKDLKNLGLDDKVQKSLVPSLNDILSLMFQFELENNSKNSFDYKLQQESTNKCTNCDKAVTKIENGIFGCEECYSLDREVTKNVLERFNNFKSYKGKKPSWYKEFEDLASSITNLQKELAESVDAEEYEKANDIKLKIEELNNKVKN
ncbi:MAG: transcriptional regulator [Tissierellia bacterium]|nr:transcriptional regulator [Tissierellia bacterium]